jgi:hypothetical protein
MDRARGGHIPLLNMRIKRGPVILSVAKDLKKVSRDVVEHV